MKEIVLENKRKKAGHYAPGIISRGLLYIPDMKYWEKINELYAEYFGHHRPARVVVPTKELHYGALVEIEAVAEVGDEA